MASWTQRWATLVPPIRDLVRGPKEGAVQATAKATETAKEATDKVANTTDKQLKT